MGMRLCQLQTDYWEPGLCSVEMDLLLFGFSGMGRAGMADPPPKSDVYRKCNLNHKFTRIFLWSSHMNKVEETLIWFSCRFQSSESHSVAWKSVKTEIRMFT